MKITMTIQDHSNIKGDCLVLGVMEGTRQANGIISGIDGLLEGQISTLLAQGDFLGKKKRR